MSSVTYTTKPSWLNNHQRLFEIVNHHLYLPKDSPQFSLSDNNAFNSGLRQYLYWKSQLLPSLQENTVFIALLGPKGLKPPNAVSITAALTNICDISQISEYYTGANTNFLAISFYSKEQVTKIISNFHFFDDAVVLSVTHNNTPLHRFRLLWLPPLFEEARVHSLLNKYTKAHRIRREFIPITGGAFSPTNVISGTFTLEPGGDINKLPYLIQLPSPHKGCALLSIESRPPLCLKCRAIGHSRQKCTMVKCTTCSKVHFPDSACGISSYSSVAARNITSSSDGDWLAYLAEDEACSQPDFTSYINADSLHPSSPLSASSIPKTSLTPSLPHSSLHITANADTECERTNNISIDSTSLTLPRDNLPAQKNITTSIPSDKTLSSSKQQQHKTLSVTSHTPPMDDSPSSIIAPPPTPVSTIATFSRHKDSSKVHISETSVTPSSTARSHLITYSTASKNSSSQHSKTSHHADLSTGDPFTSEFEPEQVFSSDYDSAPDLPVSMDLHIDSDIEPSSRKRRVSDLDPSFDSDTSSSSAISTHLEESLSSNKSFSPLHHQIATLYSANDAQISLLETLCPDSIFTPDIFKTLKLLISYGIELSQVLSSPQILRLRFTEVKRKAKFMERSLGTFTIDDICHHTYIEYKVNSGDTPLPSGPFT